MSKSLYSLILSDEVIRRIDLTAEKIGTSRSNLIDHVLADYVSYTTPEMRIKRIFEQINDLLSGSKLELNKDQSGKTMSMRTSLEYKYRPTITYSVELYRQNTASIGELKVLYRIHSQELLYKINRFFELMIDIEKKYLSDAAGYTISDGKFVRTFVIPNGQLYSQDEIARAISDYIRIFDGMLKKYLSDRYDTIEQMEYDYKIYLSKSILI